MDDTRFKKVNGYQWPIADKDCAAAVFRTVHDMDPAINLCKDNRLCIQAGGNMGVWANYLAVRFGVVMCFEPDPTNFECLKANAHDNVDCYNVGLGDEDGTHGMQRVARNAGAHFVKEGNDIEIVKFDDHHWVSHLDYVCLDIEGYELKALMGMQKTLAQHKPVVHIEDKGLSLKYGFKKGDAEQWLKQKFGYEVKHRIARDVILACP